MPLFSEVTRAHVLSALEEYDRLGDEDFLARYDFKSAPSYLLVHDEKSYDSKAILGAAQGFATGTPATWDQFSGGRNGAAKWLGSLGFEVAFAGGPVDAADLGMEEARAAWVEAARDVLVEAAGRYRAVVTQKELGAEIQERTGIFTGQQLRLWLGAVLRGVAEDCASREEPILSSLCVNDAGSVGEVYGTAVTAVRGSAPDDADDHAAKERLACHQHFGAVLPSDGGTALLTERLAASRSRARKVAFAERVIPVCPTCQMALPASGRCDHCD
jgi:hypothetical protein